MLKLKEMKNNDITQLVKDYYDRINDLFKLNKNIFQKSCPQQLLKLLCAFVKDKDEDLTSAKLSDIEDDNQQQIGQQKRDQKEFEKDVIRRFIDKTKEKSLKELNPVISVLNALRDIESEVIDDKNIQDIVEST